MKIKIIDLLTKIANNKEVPKKIKYKNEIYERYQNISTNNLYYYQVPNKCKFLIDQLSSSIDLLDEVEIIEEPKNIEKIEMYQDEEGHYFLNKQDRKVYVNCDEMDFIVDKFNELIDEIIKLKEND